MKFKPIYLYGGLIILVILYLVFFSSNNNNSKPENIVTNEMPDDNVHKGLQNPVDTPPGKENVSSDFKKKLEALKKEVEENPKDTLKIREYADLLAASHKPEDAIIYYYSILNINPRRTDILNSLAFIYFNQKNFEKAKDLINKILLYKPDNTEAMYNLGAIAATAGKKEEAKTKWEELIKKFPASKEAELAENSLKRL